MPRRRRRPTPAAATATWHPPPPDGGAPEACRMTSRRHARPVARPSGPRSVARRPPGKGWRHDERGRLARSYAAWARHPPGPAGSGADHRAGRLLSPLRRRRRPAATAVTLLICRTCPRYDTRSSGEFGRALAAAIAEHPAGAAVTVRKVQCLGG